MTTEELKDYFEKEFEKTYNILKEINENLKQLNLGQVETDKKIFTIEEKKIYELNNTVEGLGENVTELDTKLRKVEDKMAKCKYCNGKVELENITKTNIIKKIYNFCIQDLFKVAILLFVLYTGLKSYLKF